MEAEHVRWAVDDLKLPVAGSRARVLGPRVEILSRGGRASSGGTAEAQLESVPATPIGLTLGKRRPLIDLPDLSDLSHSSDFSEPSETPQPSNSSDLPGAAVTATVDDIPKSNFWEPAAREPAFAVDAGAARQRRRTWLVAVSACLALMAGFAGYWYSEAPSRQQTAVAQPAEPRPPIQAAPAAALTPIAAPEAAEHLAQPEAAAIPAPALTSSEGPRFAIRMATFQSRGRTEQALQELRDAGFTTYSVEGLLGNGTRAFAVFLGPYTDRSRGRPGS